MAIYAYCLLRMPPEEIWPVMRGIEDHPVFPLRCGKYTMLLSRLDRNFPFTPRSIVEHGQVIARVFETHTVLPMRFATFFHSERQIAQLIRENRCELLEAFCRLRGKAEMRLKLLFPPARRELPNEKKFPPQSSFWSHRHPDGDGEPLDPRRQEIARQLAARVGQMFRPLEQQVSCRLIQSRELLVDCAHLIESRRVKTYRKLCHTAAEQVKECDIRMSGPWPPYHFLPASVRLPGATAPALKVQAAAAR